MDIEIKGLERLVSKLEAMGKNVDDITRRGIHTTCNKIKRDAKLLAPVDVGDLGNSIHSKTKKDMDGIEGTVYTNSDHWYPEFGTGQRGMESEIDRPEEVHYKADWKGMPAQPFLYPAFKANQNKAAEDIKKEMQKEIRGG